MIKRSIKYASNAINLYKLKEVKTLISEGIDNNAVPANRMMSCLFINKITMTASSVIMMIMLDAEKTEKSVIPIRVIINEMAIRMPAIGNFIFLFSMYKDNSFSYINSVVCLIALPPLLFSPFFTPQNKKVRPPKCCALKTQTPIVAKLTQCEMGVTTITSNGICILSNSLTLLWQSEKNLSRKQDKLHP